MSFLLNTLLAVSLAASSFASPLSTIPHEPPRSNAFSYAPLVAEHHPYGSVNNSYIVMFKEDVAPALMANHLNFLQGVEEEHPLMGDLDVGLRHVYDGHVKGYAGKFSSDTVHRIRQMPEVDYIEQDQIVRTLEIAEPIEVDGTSLKTQKQAPWVRVLHLVFDCRMANLIHEGSCTDQPSRQTFLRYLHQVRVRFAGRRGRRCLRHRHRY